MGNAHLSLKEMLAGGPKAQEAEVCRAPEMPKAAGTAGARPKGVPVPCTEQVHPAELAGEDDPRRARPSESR